MSPTTRETADARVWSQRVTTRQDRHNNLCHQPPPRKDRASPRRRRRIRISMFRAKIHAPAPLFLVLLYTVPPMLSIYHDFTPLHGVPHFPPPSGSPTIAYLAYTIGRYSLCAACLSLPCSRFSYTLVHVLFFFHLFSLGVLELFTTGSVLAIIHYSRRARY